MKIYFISICGVGVGNLAILLKNQGHDVQGSEVSQNYFYPPMSDLLKQTEIPVSFGFDPSEITEDLDLVILGGAALIHDPENPQVKKAKELGIRTISYARGIGEFLVKENAIEVVGNHAKTTTTALTAWCLKQAGIDASYFIGGAAIGFDSTIYSGNDDWSVSEGDEYPSVNQEEGGKFLYHNPKHLIFTSADWDHKNVYDTEEKYQQTFIDLLKILPSDGLITACYDGTNVLEILKNTGKNKVNLYTLSKFHAFDLEKNWKPDEIKEFVLEYETNLREHFAKLHKKIGTLFYVSEVDYTWRSNLTRFRVQAFEVETYEVEDLGYFETPLIGQIGVENSLAVISTLYGLGFELEKIKAGIVSFHGVKRKLEVYYSGLYKVINDHAHSPIKIESCLKALRTKFKDEKIFVIFDVHQSALKERRTFEQLKYVFNLADFVLIPRVTPEMNSEDKIFGKEYKELIKEGARESKYLPPENVLYTPLIQQLKSVLENNIEQGDVVVVMSSGDVRELLDMARNLKVQTGHHHY